jgi:hypothetical protein
VTHRSRLVHVVIDVDDLDQGVALWPAALGATDEPLRPASRHVYRRLRLPDADIRVPVGRWFSGAICVLILVLAGCGDDDSARKRCKELEPQVTAEAAWNDINAMQGAVKEWLDLHCDEVIGPRPAIGTAPHTAPR